MIRKAFFLVLVFCLLVSFGSARERLFSVVDERVEVVYESKLEFRNDVVFSTLDVPVSCFVVVKNGSEYCSGGTQYFSQIVRTPILREGDRIGFRTDSKTFIGDNNYKDGVLSEWSVPVGDRNFDEFPECLPYEIEKGVCSKKWLK